MWLRCGKMLRTVVESTHIFKVLNEGETKLRQQGEASVMLILVIKAHIQHPKGEKFSVDGTWK